MAAIASKPRLSKLVAFLPTAIVIVAVILSLTPQTQIRADTWSVWKTVDDGSEGTLRWAASNAVDGDTISFDTGQIPPGSTIGLTSQIVVNKDLTITGPGADYLAISGSNEHGVFQTGRIGKKAEVHISGLRITDGMSYAGGGICNYGDLYLEYCVIENNCTKSDVDNWYGGEGGGIWNDGNLQIDHCVIRNNRTEDGRQQGGDGAGIYNTDATRASIKYSTISNNICGDHIGEGLGWGGSGGGIYGMTSALFWLNNCTVSGNSAGKSSSPDGRAGRGGGIYHTGIVRLSYCTIANNDSQNCGGGIWSYGTVDGGHAIVEARSSIIADNFAPNGPNMYGGVFSSEGCNLIGDEFSGWDYDPYSTTTDGDQLGVDPGLGVLADNGGFTQTHALLVGSPAIDGVIEGSCPKIDQRGVARPQDGNGDRVALCDIGAYELALTWNLRWGLDADPAAVNLWSYSRDAALVTLADVEWSMPSGLLIWNYGGPVDGWRFYKEGWGALNTLETLTPGKGYIGIVPTASVWGIPQG